MKKILLSITACFGFSLASAQITTLTYTYTGATQSIVIPACVSTITVDVKGAQGGGSGAAIGGSGGRVQAVMPVTPGQTLYIEVGGNGSPTGAPGYNGGGSGIGGNVGGGGGGASDIRLNGLTLNDRIIVAGGGGGATDNGGTALGGNGGGLVGANGTMGTNPWACTNTVLATGGTQSAGGLGGTSTSCAWNGFNGSLGLGGNSYNNYRCGGGGGGYYGGGGGHNGASGAGGSSYTYSLATNVIHTQGFQTGNGEIIIQYGILVTGSSNTVCSGNTLTLTASGATTYTWMPGSVTGSVAVFNPNSTTTYSLMYDNNCSLNSVYTVSVDNGPAINLNISANPVCNGNTVQISASGVSSYTWSNSSNSQSIVVTPSVSTSYTVNGTSTVSVCQGKAIASITVNPLPNLTVNSTASVLCIGSSAVLNAGGASTYTWNTSANTSSISVSPTVTTTYTVSGTGANSCANTTTFTQQVANCTGLSEVSMNLGISVYPNPSSGIIQLSSQEIISACYVNDITGKNVISITDVNVYQTSLDLNNLNSSVYLIKVVLQSGEVKQTRLIIQK